MRRILPLLVLLGGCTRDYDFVPYEGVDVFFQDPPAQVDVLLVVDNSGSMAGWQYLVGLRFDEFLSFFLEADIDYQIGVTTTTVHDGWVTDDCVFPEPGHLVDDTWITTTTPDATAVFGDMVRVGDCGSADERGLEAARMALSEEMLFGGPNEGFIRSQADLSIVFVSDEQDFSRDPVHEYLNHFYGLKGERSREGFNASALVITDAQDCIVSGVDPLTEGTRYVAAAQQTGGVVGNMCNTVFEEIFTDISQAASRVRDTWFLSEEPKVETIAVSVDDRDVPCDAGEWTYARATDLDGQDRPAIVFGRDFLPRPETQITVRYNLGGGELEGFCTSPEAE